MVFGEILVTGSDPATASIPNRTIRRRQCDDDGSAGGGNDNNDDDPPAQRLEVAAVVEDRMRGREFGRVEQRLGACRGG